MIEPPYRTVAVASTFSPRFLQVLAEAKRVRDRLCRQLHLIYVGRRDEQTAKRFSEALLELALPEDSAIHYQEGEDPAIAILGAAKANEIDLLVAGALEKEVVLRPFLGNVARTLIRKANCSVILFIKPESEPKPFSRIVFLADYSEHGRAALVKALHLAALEKCERFYVIRVYTTFDEARAKARTDAPEEGSAGARTLEEKRSRWKISSIQPARTTCRSKRAAFAATPVTPPSILSSRSTPRCSSCRSIPLRAATVCRPMSPGSPM
jgi:nucleotide-binding universal stress UspA family protein